MGLPTQLPLVGEAPATEPPHEGRGSFNTAAPRRGAALLHSRSSKGRGPSTQPPLQDERPPYHHSKSTPHPLQNDPTSLLLLKDFLSPHPLLLTFLSSPSPSFLPYFTPSSFPFPFLSSFSPLPLPHYPTPPPTLSLSQCHPLQDNP